MGCNGTSRKVRDNVNQASEVVEVHIDNVGGVKLPIFKSKHRDVESGGEFCSRITSR